MTWFNRRLRRALREEDGVASIEFVFAVPILVAIFMASFESGLFMTRSIMLEQSLDMVMRELRLGHYVNPTAASLKTEICKRTIVLTNCEASLSIDLQKISMTDFALPTTAAGCVDRNTNIAPATKLQVGQQNDLILLRACIVADAMFPTTGIGLNLTRTGQGGGYEIIAVSAFANEPN